MASIKPKKIKESIRFVNARMIWDLFSNNKNLKKLSSLPIEKIKIEKRTQPESEEDYSEFDSYNIEDIFEYIISFGDKSSYIIGTTINNICEDGYHESFQYYYVVNYNTNESLKSGGEEILSIMEKLEELIK
jgi:hypothetical protein